MVSRAMASQNVHVLILAICDYVTLCGKGTNVPYVPMRPEMGRICWVIQVGPMQSQGS